MYINMVLLCGNLHDYLSLDINSHKFCTHYQCYEYCRCGFLSAPWF